MKPKYPDSVIKKQRKEENEKVKKKIFKTMILARHIEWDKCFIIKYWAKRQNKNIFVPCYSRRLKWKKKIWIN